MERDLVTTDDELGRLLKLALPVAPPSALLRQKILASFDRVQARWTLTRALKAASDILWPGVPSWQPALAVAICLLVGIGAAVELPLERATPDDSVIAADQPGDLDQGEGV